MLHLNPCSYFSFYSFALHLSRFYYICFYSQEYGWEWRGCCLPPRMGFTSKSMVDKPHRDKQSSDWATGCPMAHHPALMASSNQQQLKYEMFWEVNKKWTQYLQQHLVKIPPKRRNVFSWVSQTGYLIEKSQIRGNWSSWISRSEWM